MGLGVALATLALGRTLGDCGCGSGKGADDTDADGCERTVEDVDGNPLAEVAGAADEKIDVGSSADAGEDDDGDIEGDDVAPWLRSGTGDGLMMTTVGPCDGIGAAALPQFSALRRMSVLGEWGESLSNMQNC